MLQLVAEFMRFTAHDLAALEVGVAETRLKLAAAVHAGEALAVVDSRPCKTSATRMNACDSG